MAQDELMYIYYMPICSMCGTFAHVWSSFKVDVGKCSIHGAFGYIHTCIIITRNKNYVWIYYIRQSTADGFRKKNNAANPKKHLAAVFSFL